MEKAPKHKVGCVSLETCQEVLRDLEGLTQLEVVLEKIDFLMEQLFLAKADLSCTFDRQFFTDAAKGKNECLIIRDNQQDNKKRLKHLCISFVRTIAKLIRKESYKRYLIPRIVAIIRLEISLCAIATKQTKDNSDTYLTFPVYVLEFLVGSVLYSEECDDELIESLISEHLLTSPEWTFYSIIALDHVKKGFDLSLNTVYKDDELPEQTFFRRFVSFLLKMPQPLDSRRVNATGFREAVDIKADNTGHKVNDDYISSESSVEYSNSSDEESTNEIGENGIKTVDVNAKSVYNYKNVYSALWQTTILGGFPLHDDLLHNVLNHMSTHILPYASNPAVYANWLFRHLNGGGTLSSMLSLKSVFELILKYGLGEVKGLRGCKTENEPISDCYQRLYQHLSVDVIASKYGAEFLKLLNMALKSTMLPSQLIAKFIKKLVRIACFTSCIESTTLLTIAVNMLKRHHHTCLTIVHTGNLDDENRVQDLFHVEKDTCYNNSEVSGNDIKDLCLWELPLLMNHFNERTAIVASTFYSDLKKKRNILLKADDIIGYEAREHLRQELTKGRRRDVNTFRKTIQKSTELTTQIFC